VTYDPARLARRIDDWVRELIDFHERRAREAEAFRETPQARHHRERAERLRVVAIELGRGCEQES
jgi:hypothetical protein